MNKETRQEYYRHLGRIQNHNMITNMPIDIMTITGLMDKDAMLNHLARYAELTKDDKAMTWLETEFNI